MKFNPFLYFYRKSSVLLFIYILLSIFLMNFNDAIKLQGIRSLLLRAVDYAYRTESLLGLMASSKEENEILKKALFEANIRNQQLREALLENLRLKRMLQFKKESPLPLLPAKVIGMGIENGVRSIVLNVGERDGIYKNMAVLNPDGLVGKVIVSAKNQSIAQLLFDHNSLVSARLQNSREIGTIAWTGNSWLNLLYIPKNIPVERGELVVTSGLSQIYPPGLKIGVVSEIEEDAHSLFKNIKVKPAVNFKELEEVFVVKGAEEKPAVTETPTGE